MPEKYDWKNTLEEYIRQGEPGEIQRSQNWQTVIGLQDVDGLKTSDYLLDTARDHIEGKINIEDAEKRIQSYYEKRSERHEIEERTREADIVSVRITALLGEKTFQFSPAQWQQIHPFCEGNTRAKAVFIIKYLQTFGFHVSNDVFAENSWYFRNALVRANYNQLQKGIHATSVYLECFFENLLLNGKHELKNRYLHLDYLAADQSVKKEISKSNNCTLNCTLEELAALRLLAQMPNITQKQLAHEIGKSERTIKKMTVSLQEKGYLRRVNGKRNGRKNSQRRVFETFFGCWGNTELIEHFHRKNVIIVSSTI